MNSPYFPDFIPHERLGGTAGVEVWSGRDSTGSPAILKTFTLGRGWQLYCRSTRHPSQKSLFPDFLIPLKPLPLFS